MARIPTSVDWDEKVKKDIIYRDLGTRLVRLNAFVKRSIHVITHFDLTPPAHPYFQLHVYRVSKHLELSVPIAKMQQQYSLLKLAIDFYEIDRVLTTCCVMRSLRFNYCV